MNDRSAPPPNLEQPPASYAGRTRFTQLEYVDGATITLRNAGGQTVTLHRQKETTQTFCP